MKDFDMNCPEEPDEDYAPTPEPNFEEKYSPFLHIIQAADEDLDTLAAQPGYSPEMGREYRNAVFTVVLGYMRSIRTDYEVLYQQTAPKALHDVELAKLLVSAGDLLRLIDRKVRLYVWLQRLAPLPGAGPYRDVLRRIITALSPRCTTGELRELFLAFAAVHRYAGARIFLP